MPPARFPNTGVHYWKILLWIHLVLVKSLIKPLENTFEEPLSRFSFRITVRWADNLTWFDNGRSTTPGLQKSPRKSTGFVRWLRQCASFVHHVCREVTSSRYYFRRKIYWNWTTRFTTIAVNSSIYIWNKCVHKIFLSWSYKLMKWDLFVAIIAILVLQSWG